MTGRPWVIGETYSICDPYLFTMAQWLEQDGVDPSRFPKVIDHRRRISERPAVQKGHCRGTRLNRMAGCTPILPPHLVTGPGCGHRFLIAKRIGHSRNTRH